MPPVNRGFGQIFPDSEDGRQYQLYLHYQYLTVAKGVSAVIVNKVCFFYGCSLFFYLPETMAVLCFTAIEISSNYQSLSFIRLLISHQKR